MSLADIERGSWFESLLVFAVLGVIIAVFTYNDYRQRRRRRRSEVLETRTDRDGALWLRTATGWHYAGLPYRKETRHGQPRRTPPTSPQGGPPE